MGKTSIDSGLLSKLRENKAPVEAVQSPIQKVVPVIESQRVAEAQVMFWADKRLKKAMQSAAISDDTDMKTIFVALADKWLTERGVDWRTLQ